MTLEKSLFTVLTYRIPSHDRPLFASSQLSTTTSLTLRIRVLVPHQLSNTDMTTPASTSSPRHSSHLSKGTSHISKNRTTSTSQPRRSRVSKKQTSLPTPNPQMLYISSSQLEVPASTPCHNGRSAQSPSQCHLFQAPLGT